jgi:Thymidylate synthase complementing protein
MISAKVIEDSISEAGVRLITLQLSYPRFIHSEFMTHRVFSRNASSSRAIPVKKMLKQVWSNPAMPIHWGQNQAGMQASVQLTGLKLFLAQTAWRTAAKLAASVAYVMDYVGAHKQVANRITEPFQYIHVIVTATEWDNFFELRDHEDAQPEIRALAKAMRAAILASSPARLTKSQWHLPYVLQYERETYADDTQLLVQLSAARCARVSYLTHDGKEPSIAADKALYDRLVGSKPMHASPVEHQAHPDSLNDETEWLSPSLHGNFRGWVQFRKLLETQ